jgi:hypothetical protein
MTSKTGKMQPTRRCRSLMEADCIKFAAVVKNVVKHVLFPLRLPGRTQGMQMRVGRTVTLTHRFSGLNFLRKLMARPETMNLPSPR